MTATRDIVKTGTITGSDHVTAVADTVNQLSKYLAGNAISPTGTNTVSFTVDMMAGLTAIPDGMRISVKMPNTNTGAMTFEITGTGTGTKAVRTSAGAAFAGGEVVAGTAYDFVFFSGDDHWKLMGQSSSASAGAYPLTRIEFITATGAYTWNAPHDCIAMVIAIGGGGSGAGREGTGTTTSGGAGGFAQKLITMASGDEIAGTVGAGGASAVAGSGSTTGNSGGTTTAVHTEGTMSLSAAGGGGGTVGGAAGAGGSATGGDLNHTGGAGSATSNSENGGGAVGIFDTGNAGTATEGATAVDVTLPVSHPYLNTNGLGTGVNTGGTTKQTPGAFCGGGGGEYNVNKSYGDDGGIGAGGGNAVCSTTTNSSYDSGAGGDGCIVIAYSEDTSA